MTFWRIVFAAAAFFNLAVGLPLLLAPQRVAAALVNTPPPDFMLAQICGVLISVFGVGYAMVARDPAGGRPIAWLGVIGKLPIPVILWFYVRADLVPVRTLLLSLGDLGFAVLFVLFLWRTAPASRDA
jgi:hypothetical protein